MIIYKITNKINNKIYIGLTTRSLEQRFKEHVSSAFQKPLTAFHKAIVKYGPENFEYIKIDEANSIEELKEKEIYHIKLNNSLLFDGFGYNMTKGGDYMENGENHPSSKLTQKEVDQIYELLKNTNMFFKEIIEKLSLKIGEHQISTINKGEQWNNPNIEYPIRKDTMSIGKRGLKNPSSKFSKEDVLEIIRILSKTNESQKNIAIKYNVHVNTIGNINNCKIFTNLHNFISNIRKESKTSTSFTTIDQKIILKIVELLSTTKISQKQIANIVGVGSVFVSNVNQCKKGKNLHEYEKNIRKESEGGGTGYAKNTNTKLH